MEKAMSYKVAKALKLNPDQPASPDYLPEYSTGIEKKQMAWTTLLTK